MARPTFLLGLGAQKAGTTWLHDYLSVNGLVQFGGRKEYHVLDSYFGLEPNAQLMRFRRLALLMQDYHQNGPKEKLNRDLVQVLRYSLMGLDLQAYRDHFITLAREHHVVGDITPSYCGLSADQLREVRNLLAPHFRLRVIYLIRDPVERLFSMCKHHSRASWSPGYGRDPLALYDEALQDGGLPGGYRSDYGSTLAAIDAAFAPADVLIEFYESLFQECSIRQITNFLGVRFTDPDFHRRPNADQSDLRLTPDRLLQGHQQLASVYAILETRFPGRYPAVVKT